MLKGYISEYVFKAVLLSMPLFMLLAAPCFLSDNVFFSVFAGEKTHQNKGVHDNWGGRGYMSNQPVKDGEQCLYYASGKLKMCTIYKNGKKNGAETFYYENGKSRLEENYIDGNLDGVQKYYSPQGKLIYETNYSNGHKDGKSAHYYSDGTLHCEKMYENGQMIDKVCRDRHGKMFNKRHN